MLFFLQVILNTNISWIIARRTHNMFTHVNIFKITNLFKPPTPISKLYHFFFQIHCLYCIFFLEKRVIKNKFYEKVHVIKYVTHKFKIASQQQKLTILSKSNKY